MVELRINSGGKLPNFGFVVFDDSEPVQKVLSNKVSKFSFCVCVCYICGFCLCVCVCACARCVQCLRGEKSGKHALDMELPIVISCSGPPPRSCEVVLAGDDGSGASALFPSHCAALLQSVCVCVWGRWGWGFSTGLLSVAVCSECTHECS